MGGSSLIAMEKEVVLTGTDLLLRPVRLSDVNEDYVRWMNDPEVNRYLETRFRSQQRRDIEEYVRTMGEKPGVYFFAMVLKDGRLHMGNIKLEITSSIHRRGEISLFIGEKEQWGRGLASQAISMVSDFALSKLKLHKLTAGCYSNNPGSARAFEKAGFTREAVLKEEYQCEGKWVDRYCYALIDSSEMKPTRQGADRDQRPL